MDDNSQPEKTTESPEEPSLWEKIGRVVPVFLFYFFCGVIITADKTDWLSRPIRDLGRPLLLPTALISMAYLIGLIASLLGWSRHKKISSSQQGRERRTRTRRTVPRRLWALLIAVAAALALWLSAPSGSHYCVNAQTGRTAAQCYAKMGGGVIGGILVWIIALNMLWPNEPPLLLYRLLALLPSRRNQADEEVASRGQRVRWNAWEYIGRATPFVLLCFGIGLLIKTDPTGKVGWLDRPIRDLGSAIGLAILVPSLAIVLDWLCSALGIISNEDWGSENRDDELGSELN